MKYKCNVIRDLMPLCVDESATDESKDVVYGHFAECKACKTYYNQTVHEINLNKEPEDIVTSEYKAIAERYHKRNLRQRLVISIILGIIFLLLLNYALGYRFTARAAAEYSGRLNPTSELIGTYDWGDVQFFFYESDGNYDTIAAVKHWNGWESGDFYFVWPKYPADKGRMVVTSGIYYFKDDEGIFILPVLTSDDEITKVTVTAFGVTKSVNIETGILSVFAFENKDTLQEDNAVGYAYDKNGDLKYELKYEKDMGRWVWMS